MHCGRTSAALCQQILLLLSEPFVPMNIIWRDSHSKKTLLHRQLLKQRGTLTKGPLSGLARSPRKGRDCSKRRGFRKLQRWKSRTTSWKWDYRRYFQFLSRLIPTIDKQCENLKDWRGEYSFSLVIPRLTSFVFKPQEFKRLEKSRKVCISKRLHPTFISEHSLILCCHNSTGFWGG